MDPFEVDLMLENALNATREEILASDKDYYIIIDFDDGTIRIIYDDIANFAGGELGHSLCKKWAKRDPTKEVLLVAIERPKAGGQLYPLPWAV